VGPGRAPRRRTPRMRRRARAGAGRGPREASPRVRPHGPVRRGRARAPARVRGRRAVGWQVARRRPWGRWWRPRRWPYVVGRGRWRRRDRRAARRRRWSRRRRRHAVWRRGVAAARASRTTAALALIRSIRRATSSSEVAPPSPVGSGTRARSGPTPRSVPDRAERSARAAGAGPSCAAGCSDRAAGSPVSGAGAEAAVASAAGPQDGADQGRAGSDVRGSSGAVSPVEAATPSSLHGGRFDGSSHSPQYRHLTAASWIDSAQKGQVFTTADGSTIRRGRLGASGRCGGSPGVEETPGAAAPQVGAWGPRPAAGPPGC